MSFPNGLVITNVGRVLQSKAQTGVPLNFTKIAIGDGDLGGGLPQERIALISYKKDIPITKLNILADGKALVGGSFNNSGLAVGYYFREIGVFATDPDVGEILYCYGNAAAMAEYIPAQSGASVIEKYVNVVTIVGNAANVTATIEASLVYVTVPELNVLTTEIATKETPAGAQAKVSAHEGAANPHPQYTVDTEMAKYENITADGQYAGEVTTEVVAADGALYDLLYLSSTGYNKARANADATLPCLAMRVEIGIGSRKLLKSGYVRNDAWNWVRGQLLYVSPTTAGIITATKPATSGQRIQIVGYAVSPDIIYFNPDYTWIEI
jgi:hypothetical protein